MAISEGTKAQLISGFYKLLPYISGALASRGVITAEQGTAIVNGAPEFMSYLFILAGVAGGVWTAIWSWWKNRPAKRVADIAKIDGVTPNISDPKLVTAVLKVDPAADITVARQ